MHIWIPKVHILGFQLIATNKRLFNQFRFHTFLLLKDQTYHYQLSVRPWLIIPTGYSECRYYLMLHCYVAKVSFLETQLPIGTFSHYILLFQTLVILWTYFAGEEKGEYWRKDYWESILAERPDITFIFSRKIRYKIS